MNQIDGLTLSNTVVQGQGNIVTDMDGEKVMLSVAKGKYFNLGLMGGEIWELITTPTSITDIVSRLLIDYDVEKEVCEQQVLSFLNQLQSEGLIETNV
nr:lasso peptide biosynthesis PqqD family chaperone [Alkalihalobacterium bogoriense]